jgi:hypothetical protein
MNWVGSFIIGYSIPVLARFSTLLLGAIGVALFARQLPTWAPVIPERWLRLKGTELLRWLGLLFEEPGTGVVFCCIPNVFCRIALWPFAFEVGRRVFPWLPRFVITFCCWLEAPWGVA